MNPGRRKTGRDYNAAVAFAFAIVFASITITLYIYARQSYVAVPRSKPQFPIDVNVNVSDVAAATGTTSYVTYESDNVTYPAALLASEGYMYVSSSAFVYARQGNATNYQYPFSIVSSVYYMRNASSAAYALNSTFFTNNANQKATASYYSLPNGARVLIYVTSSVALYNSSIANAVLSQPNSTEEFPVSDATSSFIYGDSVGIVTVNGYKSSNNINVSINIAQRLLNRLYAANFS